MGTESVLDFIVKTQSMDLIFMTESLEYLANKKLVKIVVSGVQDIKESWQSLEQVEDLMQSEPKPEALFVDLMDVSKMPQADEILFFAQRLAESPYLKDLKIALLLDADAQEDMFLINRITSIKGINMEFFYDRQQAVEALNLL